MLFRALCLSFLAGSLCRLGFAQCEPAPDVKQILEAYAEAGRGRAPDAGKRAARSQILEKGLAAAPTNYFLLDRRRDLLDDNTSAGQEASITYFSALHQKYPDSPGVTAVYADALRVKDSAQALKLLESSEKAHPDFPWTRLKLLSVLNASGVRDKARIGETIDSFLKSCPATSNAFVYRILLANGTEEQIGRNIAALRARLEGQPDAPNQNLWEALWDLEFKAVPPSGHAAVRERIAKDLALLDKSPQHNQLAWLNCLRKGYADVGDIAGADRIDGQIQKDYPDSREAEQLVTKRWRTEHPFPSDKDQQAKQAWYRASAAAASEWYARWHGLLWLMQEFSAVAALEDTKPADLLSLAEKYVQDYHENPNSFYGALPIEFDVSDALIRKKVLSPSIPQWIDDGYHRETNRPSRMLGQFRDQLSAEQKKRADDQVVSMRIERARILLDYYDALGQPSKSRAVEDELAGLVPADERMKPAWFEVRAKAAELDHRQLDALVLYRAARALGGKPGPRGQSDVQSLDEKIAALWKELGGTSASRALFTGSTKIEPVSAIRWEVPKNQLPAFTLTGLDGKVWTLANLHGKATLINVWATWCGPCQAEHPEFQRLYEKLKDRADIAVLSVNVDDEAGLVAPYMAEHHYSFPVVFGRSLLEAVSGNGEMAIPQNWFVTPAAKLESTQLGYGGDPAWQSTMSGKLEQMAKAK